MEPTIPMERWEWWGRAGHFIGASECRFHLHTHVGTYCVSTVGGYRDLEGKHQRLGADGRTHETMVFRHLSDGTNDYGDELDFAGYDDDDSAAAGHMRMCRRWAARAASEERFEALYGVLAGSGGGLS